MNEIWKDVFFIENGEIFDYRGLYQVSNFGRVKSFRNGKEKILKPVKEGKGYWQSHFCKNGKIKKIKIHRLVAHMFLSDSYFENAQVNHIDENKENNHVSNLEWCNNKYNNNYGTKKTKNKKIDRFDLQGNYIDTRYNFEYVEMGFDASNISACCVNKRKTHKGFIFKYYKKND